MILFFIWDKVVIVLFLSAKYPAATNYYYLLLPVLKCTGQALFTTLWLIFSHFSGMAVLYMPGYALATPEAS